MDQQELRQTENRCIQEWVPWCSARCPVHVDVKAMNEAVRNRDFSLAAKVFRKRVPFPGVISRICDHPCEDVCRRKDVDDAISIREMELAAMTLSLSSREKIQVLRGKGKRVAVVGAGLSGLTAAVDLAKKGWGIVVFEASDKPGGRLRDYPASQLPGDVLERDLEILEQVPVELRFNSRLGSDFTLSDLEEEFDAVYLAIGAGITTLEDLETDREGRVAIDPVTFQTSRPSVFAGGKSGCTADAWSPIQSISQGRRAAISIDRYVQKVSLTASRDNEGPYETRLFTSVEGVERSSRIPVTDTATGYSDDHAVQEAHRCLQCECMECVKVCEYLAAFKGYPKKYVRQVYNNLSIVSGQRHGNLLINSCSLCGLCKEVCPEDLHMGEVCRAARETMVLQNRMPSSAHEFALRDMEFSNSDLCTLARHEPGLPTSAYLFYPGCQLSGSSPENVGKTYAYLRERLKGGVGIMLGCCGAPADWSGRKDLFERTFSEFETQWRDLGSPTIIVACSSCLSMFSPRLPGEKITSLWEIIDGLGLPEPQGMEQTTVVSLHDPCTARNEPAVQESVRNLVKKLGFEVHEPNLTRDTTECCGFGGLMYFANRALADRVIQRRIDVMPHNLLTYCAMCRDQYASHGKPAWHLLDLIFSPGATEAVAKGSDYSQRRENRARLKASLLRDLWKEESVKHEGYRDIELHIAEDVRVLLEKRMILVEDIQQVIQWAEKTGNRLIHQRTGHCLAHDRPGTVTYWVEYSESGQAYTIHNAYSHRMEILEDIRQ